jgi:hypothetical protein
VHNFWTLLAFLFIAVAKIQNMSYLAGKLDEKLSFIFQIPCAPQKISILLHQTKEYMLWLKS